MMREREGHDEPSGPWTWYDWLMLAIILGCMVVLLLGELTGRLQPDMPRAADSTYAPGPF